MSCPYRVYFKLYFLVYIDDLELYSNVTSEIIPIEQGKADSRSQVQEMYLEMPFHGTWLDLHGNLCVVAICVAR